MNLLSRLGVLILIPALVAATLNPLRAEETPESSSSGFSPDINLRETEITQSLKDILGNYRLEEMEIIGNVDTSPGFNYILRWQRPVPFPDETEKEPRNLIDPYYAPLDSERFRQMIEITTDE